MGKTGDALGVFIGLEHSRYEYIANIIAPYRVDFDIDLGSFILIEDTPSKLVARIIDFVPQGELVSFMGQKWLSDVALNSEAIGSDIKKRKISYSVKIKLLGTLSQENVFDAGLKRIPHITSRVVKPTSDEVNQIIHQSLSEDKTATRIGEYYLDRNIKLSFNLSELVSKRSFIFARAGYGKSNLMKILASSWNDTHGSLVIFDPDGEYAFTDTNKRQPGIMDKRGAILITNSEEAAGINNVYRKLRLNLKQLRPSFVIPVVVPEEKHNMIFFSKLMGLDIERWGRLVDLIADRGWGAPNREIKEIVVGHSGEDDEKEKDMVPILNNLVHPIQTLHDPNSHLLNIVESAMKGGHIIIIDVSLLDSKTALRLSSLLVKHTLNKNQRNFIIGSKESLINATFVMDEAQSVLSKDASVSAFVELAKEGRKYHLGAIFITQQPGTIPFEILSQADNFFVFHLLSRGDLESLQKANAHYSNDVITQILNEPKRGKCYMWSSAQPFVLPVQIDNFEDASIVGKSTEVQSRFNLLDGILKEVIEDLQNPIFARILEKYSDIESKYSGEDMKVRTIELYTALDENEKEFLRKKPGAIQTGPNGSEFAITFKYYRDVLPVMSKVEG